MGNSSSSGRHHDETVDYGCLFPQGVYSGPRDWNQAIVSQLIVARKLAPFYRPLEDYEDSWDDDQILAARKELPDPDNADSVTRIEAPASSSVHSTSHKSKRPASLKEPARPEAHVYRGAVECPICFLYYPPNINHSRCCDQAICTECFVQIKRAEPTATHLVSEPAACPYCVQENFGVVYNPPPWRAGLGNEGSSGMFFDARLPSEPSTPPTHKRRQKSFGADSPDVVTTDQIRPDWEDKLEAVRAQVARRANRRIIMRQVGDRLIPVGVTSGRVHALTPEEAAAASAAVEASGSRRNRRRQAQNGSLEQFMGMAGQDLEELMLMEAMRLSLLDHEEHQRKEAEEKKKQETALAANAAEGSSNSRGKSSAADNEEAKSIPISDPGPSTLEARSSLEASSSSNLSLLFASRTQNGNPSPKHAKVDSQDSPGRRLWSLSRSRTPSPKPTIPSSNDDNPWRNHPSPFSTLNATTSAASTASAILGPPSSSAEARYSRTATPEPNRPNLPTSLKSNATKDISVPTIKVDTAPLPGLSSLISERTMSSLATSISDLPLSDASVNVPSALSSISSFGTESESGTGIGVASSSNGHLPTNPFLSDEELVEMSMPKVDNATNNDVPAASAYLEEVSR